MHGVEVFTKQEFEEALPHGCVALGNVEGEYCYLLPITPKTGILIRSSVDRTGYSGGCGEDSIRIYPTRTIQTQTAVGTVWSYNLQGCADTRWITRIKGWELRLVDALKKLSGLIEIAGVCDVCGEPRRILKVKKNGANKGRWFASCTKECDLKKKQFVWLD